MCPLPADQIRDEDDQHQTGQSHTHDDGDEHVLLIHATLLHCAHTHTVFKMKYKRLCYKSILYVSELKTFLVSLKTDLIEVCQNNSLWNVILYDVIVWINPAPAEDQRLLPRRCPFSPAHRLHVAARLAPPTDSTSLHI